MNCVKLEKLREITNKSRIEPVVYISGNEDKTAPGSRCGPIIRDVFIIECCTEGYGSVYINGTEFPIFPRCAYVLMPGDIVTHTASCENPRRGYSCSLDGLQLSAAFKKAGIDSKKPYFPEAIFEEIEEHLKALYETRNEKDEGASFRQASHVYAILGAMLRETKNTDSYIWIDKAKNFMETYYQNIKSIDDVAAEVGLDRSYFSTLFKKKMGATPHSYLTSLRIKKASALICESDYSMAEIAESVGIDFINFSRIFKREVGLTPTEYKKSKKSRNS